MLGIAKRRITKLSRVMEADYPRRKRRERRNAIKHRLRALSRHPAALNPFPLLLLLRSCSSSLIPRAFTGPRSTVMRNSSPSVLAFELALATSKSPDNGWVFIVGEGVTSAVRQTNLHALDIILDSELEISVWRHRGMQIPSHDLGLRMNLTSSKSSPSPVVTVRRRTRAVERRALEALGSNNHGGGNYESSEGVEFHFEI